MWIGCICWIRAVCCIRIVININIGVNPERYEIFSNTVDKQFLDIDLNSDIQWSRTLTVHSDRDELIMYIKFLFPYHLQLINLRRVTDRHGHYLLI